MSDAGMSPGDHAKPIPEMGTESRAFWDGARQHRLMLQQCTDCGTYQWFPRSMCKICMSDQLKWVEARGTGKIYSFTVTYRGPSAAFADPYAIALVELDEGVRVMTNIVGYPLDDIRVEMPVKVTFEDWTPDISIMQFTPCDSGD
jgi:uncharacterized protein